MNQEIKAALKAAGVNIEEALSRLMNNEVLLKRLLLKFKEDKNFTELEQAVLEKRYEDAFHCAHTLKGVAGNLGLEKLMNADIAVVEKLRCQNSEGLEEELNKVREAYTQVMEIIERIE